MRCVWPLRFESYLLLQHGLTRSDPCTTGLPVTFPHDRISIHTMGLFHSKLLLMLIPLGLYSHVLQHPANLQYLLQTQTKCHLFREGSSVSWR